MIEFNSKRVENIVVEGVNGSYQHFFPFSDINPFPNKPWFLHVWSTNLLKTPLEK